MKAFTLAVIQVECCNLEKSLLWAKKAVYDEGADLIVFPETITTGFLTGLGRHELYETIDTVPGKMTEPFQKCARELKTNIILPVYEKNSSVDRIYNSAAVIDSSGNIMGVHRKTHPFPAEDVRNGGWVTPGSNLSVFELPFVKLGIIICYEGDFPHPCEILVSKGAEMIIRPSALLRDYNIWELTNRARAFDNNIYLVGANSIGKDPGGNYYYGHSMIIDPLGRKISQAGGDEEILIVKIKPFSMDVPYNHQRDKNVLIS